MTANRVSGDVPVVTAETAAERIPADATVYTGGIGAGSKAVSLALARSDRDLSLSVVSSSDAGFITDTQVVANGHVSFRYPFAVWPDHRRAANNRTIESVDDHFSSIRPRVLQGEFDDPTVALVEAVAVEEDRFVPTTAIGAVPTFVQQADQVIVEVNEAVPRTVERFHDVHVPEAPPRSPVPIDSPGDQIGQSFVELPGGPDAVVETSQQPMPYPFEEPSDDQETIADRTVDFLAEEAERNPLLADQLTLEVGVGTLGDEIMRRLGTLATADRELAYYGEVIQDGLLELIAQGDLDAASGTGLVLSQDGLDRLYDEPEQFVDSVSVRPLSVSNEPSVIRRLGVVGVNNVLEVDIYGNANSSHVRGSKLVQGTGGSGDFARNALVSVVVLPSTTSDGEISRIVPKATHVTHPSQDVDIVVTEQGVADLRGAGPTERAECLIEECAAPAFRDDLFEYLDQASEDAGHVPHDLGTAFDQLER